MHVVGARGPTKRLVVVADNSLIVEAIAIGLRTSGAFELLGHVNARTGSVKAIVEAAPDVVLLDDLDGSDMSVELVSRIKAEQPQVAVIVLATTMDPDWLDAIFAAGAAGAISKATHPAALATLVRETVEGHVVLVYESSGVAHPARRGHRGGRADPAHLAGARGPPARRDRRDEWRYRAEALGHRADGEVPPLSNVYRKLEVGNRTEASRYAYVNGLVGAADTGRRLLNVSRDGKPSTLRRVT